MKVASRLDFLQSSIYSQLDDLRKEIQASGKSTINLSIGSPDMAPPEQVRKVLSQEALHPEAYGYTLTRGTAEFREACANWYQKRFQVELDPETEILPVLGSQDGLAHIYWAFIDSGDSALIPDPGYPIYTDGLLLAGGKKIPLPLTEEFGFLPDLNAITAAQAKQAKLMILNYPNNPTAAVAPRSFFQEVVDFALEHDIIVCHDAAYTELAFDGYRPASFMQSQGAKKVGVEFHSLSKTFNMAGTRLGFVVGNAYVIRALEKVKSNIDYGSFGPILKAGAVALAQGEDSIRQNQTAYQRRRDAWVDGCALAGWNMPKPKGSMFVWAPVPKKQDSLSFVLELARETGVILVPGVAFGQHGEGYVRIGLVREEDILQEAVARVRTFLEK